MNRSRRSRQESIRSAASRAVRLTEPLERRVLMSTSAASPFVPMTAGNVPEVGTVERVADLEFETINWQGRTLRTFKDTWIVRYAGIDGTMGQQNRQMKSMLAEMGEGFSLDRHLVADGVFTVKAPSDLTEAQVVQALSRLPGYIVAEPDFVNYTDAIPNDPSFSSMWGLRNTGQSGGTPGIDINAATGWDITTGDGTQIVGIIDSGVDYNHPDLAANIFINPGEVAGNGIDDDANGFVDDVRGWNFLQNNNDPMGVNSHGTHVAGTVAARGNNGVGVTGVAWNAKILPFKVGGVTAGDTSISTSAAISALNYSVMMKNRGFNIRVTNNSWGGPGFNSSLVSAIQANGNAGILFVCASGNDGLNIDLPENARYPAAYSNANIITVANHTRTGARNGGSNFGPIAVDIAAPGTSILSTIVGGGYDGSFTGTSMSSPHVAGAAALLFTIQPNAGFQAVKNAILNTGTATAAFTANSMVTGNKRLNLQAALASFANLPGSPTTPTLAPGSDTGFSSTDLLTNDNTPTITGTALAGATVRLFADGAEIGSMVVPGSGSWSITTPAMADGTRELWATATNTNGTSLPSVSTFVTIDTVAPTASSGAFPFAVAPHSTSFNFSEDMSSVFSLSNATVTNLTTSSVIPSASLAFSYDGVLNLVSISFPGLSNGLLSDGNYRVQVNATDAAGNVMAAPFSYTIYMLYGDADRDRDVDIGDFSRVAANFNASPRNFGQGDFNYSGTVDIGDFALLASRFNTNLPAPGDLPRPAGAALEAPGTSGDDRPSLWAELDTSGQA